MQSHNSQLRCLQHNNTLTVYCQTERRALCANCVYGANRHRTHRLLPLKDASPLIAEDNILLRTNIESDLTLLEDSIRNSQRNTTLLEKELKLRLRAIEEEYLINSEDIKRKYHSHRQQTEAVYGQVIEQCRNIEKGVEEFKFKLWETLSKIGIGKGGDVASADIEVGKQVLCANLAQISTLIIQPLTPKQFLKLAKRIPQ